MLPRKELEDIFQTKKKVSFYDYMDLQTLRAKGNGRGQLLKRWLLGCYLEKNVKTIYEVIHASNYNKCFCQFPVDNYAIKILHRKNAN